MAAAKLAKPLRVAVVGGGIGGPTAALFLKHLGCQPTVFESAPEITEVGAGISLAPNGLRVLRSLGLADKVVKEAGEPIFSMRAITPAGEPIVSFPTLAVEKYGLPMAGFRRFRLRAALLEEMARMDVPLELGKRLQDIQQEQQHQQQQQSPALLTFEDGSTYEADMVVGCDGLRSVVRRIVRGAHEAPPRYTGEEVVFAVLKDRHHDLVPPNTLVTTVGPGHKQTGAYGLGPDCCWFTSCPRASARDSWGRVEGPTAMEEIKEELARQFAGWEHIQSLLACGTAVAIRVGIFDRDPVSSWGRGVVTLAGDAASPIPPNLGQGGNKAMEDAGVLAASLSRCKGDVPAALQLYEQLRVKRAADVLRYSRQAVLVQNVESSMGMWLRDNVMRLLVKLNKTIPSDWLWAYDCQREVQAATL